MKQWKRICALMMSVLTMGTTILGAGCKEKEDSSDKKHSHEWVTKVTKEATCTEKGKKTKTCEICGEKETESIEPSHSLVKYGAQAPTCTVDGWEAYEMCENCDYTTKVVISANGHNFVNGSCINQGCGQKQNDDDNRPSQGGNEDDGGSEGGPSQGGGNQPATIVAPKAIAGFNSAYTPAQDLIERKQGQIDVVLVFEGTLPGWEALASEYERLHGGAVDVKLNSSYDGDVYTQNLSNQVNNNGGEWDIVQGNLFAGNGLQTYCIDMYTSVIGKNAYAGVSGNGQARYWKQVLTEDAYITDKSGASTHTYIMNTEGLQTAWFVNDVARDAALMCGYTGPETPETWDQLMDLCYYMEQAGYENPLGISLDKDSIGASQFNWLLGVYGDYYYRNEYQNIMLVNEYEYNPEDTNPEADMYYAVSANKLFYSIFQYDRIGYVGPFSGKYQEFIEQLAKMKPYLRSSAMDSAESSLKALRAEFATQSKGTSSPQILLDYAGAGLAFLKNENAGFQVDFFDYPVMESEYIPQGTALRDVGNGGGCLSIVNHDKAQNDLNLDFMKFVMSPYGQSIYYEALNASGSVPMGMTTVKSELVVVPAEWKTFFQTDKITFNGTVDGNPYLSYFIRGFAGGSATKEYLSRNWQMYLGGTGKDALDLNGFCMSWGYALEEDWHWYKVAYGKDESLRTDPYGGVAL